MTIALLYTAPSIDPSACMPAVERFVEERTSREVTLTSGDCWEFPQYFFDDILFLEVETTSVIRHPAPADWRPIRVAVTVDSEIYGISGLKMGQFNELANLSEIAIDSNNVRGFGWFYIDVTYTSGTHGDYRIADLEDFIAFQHSRCIDSLVPYSNRDWETEKSRLRDILGGADFDGITRGVDLSSFTLDYYVWSSVSGVITHIGLEISPRGECRVAVNETIGKDAGYYIGI